jgi:hypothetical protein
VSTENQIPESVEQWAARASSVAQQRRSIFDRQPLEFELIAAKRRQAGVEAKGFSGVREAAREVRRSC